jgi:hypothetical protein
LVKEDELRLWQTKTLTAWYKIMISDLPLDIFIGFILLTSMYFFYEKTMIFFVFFDYWLVMLIIAPIVLFIGSIHSLGNIFADLSKYIQVDESQGVIRESLIPNIIDLVKMVLGSLVWLAPMMIDLIFAGLAVFIAKSLNHHLSLDDVYMICLMPIFFLIPICYFPQLQNFFSENARYSIGLFGIIINTLIIALGGYASAKALSVL